MKRRTFIKRSSAATLAVGLGNWQFPVNKTHLLTLSFDDGFKKSFYRIAEIHEAYGLKACLNVIASGHLPKFKAVDDWILPELLGNFNDWNVLKNRGHEVMPHTWEHLNLTKVSKRKAKKNIDKCLSYFEKHLEGYQNEGAVYNFAFNASTPGLENYLLERVSAVRTGAWLKLENTRYNLIPTTANSLSVGAWTSGPNLIDDYVEEEVNNFLASDGGWLIINLHGLDKEGWGPISTQYLDQLLKRLVNIQHLAVLPTGEVLKEI